MNVKCMWEYCRTLTDDSIYLSAYCIRMKECSACTDDTLVSLMCRVTSAPAHTLQTALKFRSVVVYTLVDHIGCA